MPPCRLRSEKYKLTTLTRYVHVDCLRKDLKNDTTRVMHNKCQSDNGATWSIFLPVYLWFLDNTKSGRFEEVQGCEEIYFEFKRVSSLICITKDTVGRMIEDFLGSNVCSRDTY